MFRPSLVRLVAGSARMGLRASHPLLLTWCVCACIYVVPGVMYTVLLPAAHGRLHGMGHHCQQRLLRAPWPFGAPLPVASGRQGFQRFAVATRGLAAWFQRVFEVRCTVTRGCSDLRTALLPDRKAGQHGEMFSWRPRSSVHSCEELLMPPMKYDLSFRARAKP